MMFEASAVARGPISAVSPGLANKDKEIISAARLGNLGKILGLRIIDFNFRDKFLRKNHFAVLSLEGCVG
jgi:hypothetical protein